MNPNYVWRAYRQLSGPNRGHTYLFSPSGKKIADFGGHNGAAVEAAYALNSYNKKDIVDTSISAVL